jgi:hypothetical protein
MSTASLYPNATITVGGPIGGGAASAHAAVTDGSDLTSIRVDTLFTFGLTSWTLPAGTIICSATLGGRGQTGSGVDSITLFGELRRATGSEVFASFAMSYPTTPITSSLSTPANIWVSDQATFDGLELYIASSSTVGSALYLYMFELFVNVVYVSPPGVTVGGPSGTITTASPTLTWTHSGDVDSDAGGAQQRYEVRVFSAAQYGALGFDPATSTAVYDSGDVVTNATSLVIGPLANAVTYKAYVATAQNVNGTPQWSSWTAGSTFTTNTDPPTVATITAVPTPDTDVEYLDMGAGYITTPETPDMAFTGPMRLTWRARVDSVGAGWPAIIVKAPEDLWVYVNTDSVGQDDYMGFHTNAASGPAVFVIQSPFTFGEAHTYGVEFTPGSAAMVGIVDGVRTSGVATATVTATLTGSVLRLGDPNYSGGPAVGWLYWAQLEHIGGSVVWRFDGTEYPGSGSSYTDPRGRTWTISAPNAILAGGAVKVTATRDTGHPNWTHVQVERSAVDVQHWQPVRGALAAPASAPNIVTVYDYEQPEGVDLWYRARGLIKSGATVLAAGPWKQTGTATVWHPGDCREWLRGAGDPYSAVEIELVVDEATVTTEHRVGLLDVIGRASPVAVWDTPSLGTGEMTVVTRTFADAAALQSLLRTAPVILYQGRHDWGHPYRWMAVVGHATARVPSADVQFRDFRLWTITYVEVDPPVVTA